MGHRRSEILKEFASFADAYSDFVKQTDASLGLLKQHLERPSFRNSSDIVHDRVQRIDNVTLQMSKLIKNWNAVNRNAKKT